MQSDQSPPQTAFIIIIIIIFIILRERAKTSSQVFFDKLFSPLSKFFYSLLSYYVSIYYAS